ncbi:UNVERIFIED_CONTAM: hypothetical protein PYX00_003226 [Menopon gallinae]|uniref:Amidase domain-containing protein n=1 Tax=Menopon gallinae TaxID=328185 RepID=A0AAW2I157_9NEOP
MSVIDEIIPTFLRLILRIVQIISAKVLSIWYGGETSGIPTPKSSLLMESATSLASRIRNGKVKSYDVVETFVRRIAEVNGVLNCVADGRYEEALEEAKRIDEMIASGSKTVEEMEENTPLLGVPFTTKDSVAVAGLIHAAGTKARKDVKADKDSEVVRLMRKAGAIPLAVTNVSELCFWWETNNPVFGKTNNPYNLNRTAGGSSGGEGSLITSCGSPLGIGSDIGGSIRIPAAFNGIFGHKPSAEVTPLDGLFPMVAPQQMPFNTVGPMSRFSADLLTAMKVITTDSKADLRLDEEVNLKDLTYYYLEDDGGLNSVTPVDQEIKAAVTKVVDHINRKYGVSAKKLKTDKLRYGREIWMTKMTQNCKPQISALLTNNESNINVGKELLKAPFRMSNHTMGTLLMAFLEESAAPADSAERKMYDTLLTQMKKEFEEVLGSNGVLIYPTHPTAAFYHYQSLFRPFDFAYTAIFNILGLPATHCPTGLNSEGLPIGIQVIAGKNQDRLTLALAREIEEAFGGWRPSPTKGTLVLKNRTLMKSGS